MEQKTTKGILNAMTAFGDANSEMIEAITNAAKEICKDYEIMFDNYIDVATSNAIMCLGYDKVEDVAYVVDQDKIEYSLDDLTGNELYAICVSLEVNTWKYIK